MSDETLDRLVDLAHVGALSGPEQFVHEIDWVFSDKYAMVLLELIHGFVPPHPILEGHQAAPDQSTRARTDDTPRPDTDGLEAGQPEKRVCDQCCEPGHDSEILPLQCPNSTHELTTVFFNSPDMSRK